MNALDYLKDIDSWAARCALNDINRIELRGHIASIKFLDNLHGRVARFSLVTLHYDSESENGYEISWHKVRATECENCELTDLGRGSAVHLSGRFRTYTYTDEDGVEKQDYEVVADRLMVVDEKIKKIGAYDNDQWE